MGCAASTTTATSGAATASARRSEQPGSRPGSTRPVTPANHLLVVDIPRIATSGKRKGDHEDTISTNTVVLATSAEEGGRASSSTVDPQLQASLRASLRPTTSMAETVLKVLLVGPSTAGKTTLATRMEGRNFNDEYTQTAAVQFFFTTLPYEPPRPKAVALDAPQRLSPPGNQGKQGQDSRGTEQQANNSRQQSSSQHHDSVLARQRRLSLQLWDIPGALTQADTGAGSRETSAPPPFAAERFDAALVVVDPAASTAAQAAQSCVRMVQAHVGQPPPVFYLVATKQDLRPSADRGEDEDEGGSKVNGDARSNAVACMPGEDDDGLSATGTLRNNEGTEHAQANRSRGGQGDRQEVGHEGDNERERPGAREDKAIRANGDAKGGLKTDGSNNSSEVSRLEAVEDVARVFEVSAKLSHAAGAFERQLARALAEDCVKAEDMEA